jgi:hypothetical protein
LPPAEKRWTLQRFEHEFDLWVERDNPSDDIRIFVLQWVQGRMDDPYLEVFRSPEIENLWYGPITENGYLRRLRGRRLVLHQGSPNAL